MQKLCSVCETHLAEAGSLACLHQYCTDCFSRFVSGSLRELGRNLRCCICGKASSLSSENHNERIILRFGRDREPRFLEPVALMMNNQKEFIIPDASKKRIFLRDSDGGPRNDFAYVHGITASGGTAVTKNGFILMPFQDNNELFGLGFYTREGSFLTSTYMPPDSTIGDVAVNSKDHIYVTDPKNGKIYVIKEARQKISGAVDVHEVMGDRYPPQPYAIVFDNEDNIILSDIANHCVKVFDFKQRFLFSFGSLGERPGQFNNPVGITVDEQDRIIVADRNNHRVQLFDAEGTFIEYIVRYNKGEDVYMAPVDVASVNDNVAVLLKGIRDAHAGEVRVYSVSCV